MPFTPHLSTPSQHRATPGVRLAFLEGTDMKCPGQCQPGGGRRDFRRQRCPAQLPLAAGASHPRRGGPVPQASWAATVRSTPRPSFRSPPAPPGPASLVTPSPQPAPFFLPSKLPGPCPIVPPTHTHTAEATSRPLGRFISKLMGHVGAGVTLGLKPAEMLISDLGP